MTLVQAANQHIPKSDNRRLVSYKEGTTGDIIKEVLSTYQHCRHDLKQFAPALQKNSSYDTCKAVWQFVKKHIAYKVDPPGKQYIKTPARIWQDKECDCKGYSIFIACCLTSLGLPVTFRFVSFNADPTPTHVYVVSGNIVLDCVMDAYDKEHAYSSKKDFDMTEISRLSGMPVIAGAGTTSLLQNRKFGQLSLPTIGCTCTDAVDAALLLQRLEAEMYAEMRTTAWTDARLAHYQDAIKHCKALIKSYEAAHVAGIFDEIKRTLNSGTRTGIVAALQKPEIAFCFLYGFIPDGSFAQNRNAKDVISQLPPAFREKKAKQVQLYQFIVATYKLRDPEFWQPVRATLTTFFGKSPEAYLNDILAANIQDREAVITGKPGIMGFIEDAITTLVPGGNLLQKAGSIFKNLFGKQAGLVASELGVSIPPNLALDSIKPGAELEAYLQTSQSEDLRNLEVLRLDTPIREENNVLDIFTIKPPTKTGTLTKDQLRDKVFGSTGLYARRNEATVKIYPQSDGSIDYLDTTTGERYNVTPNLDVSISTRTGAGNPYTDGADDTTLKNVTITPKTESAGLMYGGLALLALLLLKKK